LNNEEEQIVLYLYEFKYTPEKGVGPDPRLTIRGISEGTQISISNVGRRLQRLVDRAFIRPVLIGYNTYHYLTAKGYRHVEKIEHESFKIGIDERGLSLGFKKSEIRGV